MKIGKHLPPEVLELFRKVGSKGGKRGGPARMASMTPEERSAFARLGGLASKRGRLKQKSKAA